MGDDDLAVTHHSRLTTHHALTTHHPSRTHHPGPPYLAVRVHRNTAPQSFVSEVPPYLIGISICRRKISAAISCSGGRSRAMSQLASTPSMKMRASQVPVVRRISTRQSAPPRGLWTWR